ncbi:MAG: membrane-anchored protein YejM (alkaline phosphatase superfamily) [Paraglaciecola sp.]|jgi:membrane-anchored protein YejM (alkaline phosphatase superfamily)
MILTETPRRKLITQLVNWGHWFALINMLLAIAIATIYIFNSPAPETLLGVTYLFINWVSHIGFLTFFGFIIFVLPLCYLVPSARTVKGVSAVLAAIALALLALDALLYNKYGVHLSLNSAQLIRNEANNAISGFGWQKWSFFLLIFFFWLSTQLIIANAIWKRIGRLQKRKLALPIISFFIVCFVSSHALHIWADANLYHPIVQQDDLFPLSYPATAKTLMSRYKLLDRENYDQRKELQFNQSMDDIRYPLSPIYCSVIPTQKVLMLVQIDKMPFDTASHFVFDTPHLGNHSSIDAAKRSLLFGLPELYHPALSKKIPVLLDLPRGLGLNVGVYSEEPIKKGRTEAFQQDWQTFATNIADQQTHFGIAFVTAEQINSLLSPQILQQYQVLLLKDMTQDGQIQQRLYSNIPWVVEFSSTEDIAPTLLNMLGCNASEKTYSTGRDLQKTTQDWAVTTQGHKVIVMQHLQRIEVLSNGSTRVFNLQNGEENFATFDTALLSQAIKRLSSFSVSR